MPILINGSTGISASGNIITNGVAQAATANITGNISGDFVFDSKGELRTQPVNNQTTSYTLSVVDSGKYVSTNANVTVPSSTFAAGQSVTIYNNSSSSITLVQGAGVTMYNVGTASTGDRTLAQRGLATVFCVGANTFVISGVS